MIPDSDVAIMLRLQEGDDLALNELMTRWQKPLVAFLYRQTGDAEESLDLAQETFVRVYESRHRYKPAGKFSTWLFTIAANLCRNLHRWRARHPTVPMDGPEENPSELPDASTPFDSAHCSEMAALVRTEIQALPFDLRTAILLFEYEEMSHQEIAAVLDCSPKAVETRLYRARNILRQRLSKVGLP